MFRCLLAGWLLILAQIDLRADDRSTAETLRTAGATTIEVSPAGEITRIFFKDASKLTADEWKLIGTCKHAKSMTFYNQCTLNDDTLPLLAGLTAIEEFSSDGAKISDEGLKHFTNWPKLRKLTFFHAPQFSGTGFASFKSLEQFTSLSIGGSRLTDEGLAAIAQLEHLKDLRIWHNRLTAASHESLAKMKNLTSLFYGQDPRATLAAIPTIATLANLETFTLLETRVTAQQLAPLAKLSQLKQLNLTTVDIAASELEAVRTALPKVQIKWTAPDELWQGRLEKAFATNKN